MYQTSIFNLTVTKKCNSGKSPKAPACSSKPFSTKIKLKRNQKQHLIDHGAYLNIILPQTPQVGAELFQPQMGQFT